MPSSQPIGVFDSGYGGLTVLKSIVEKLPVTILFTWAIMPGRLMEIVHLKPFISTQENVCNGFFPKDVRL